MNSYLELASKKAWEFQGLTYPNPPVGALVSDENSEILAIGVHEFAGGPHAEVNAIKAAYIQLTKDTSIQAISDASQLHRYLKANHQGIFKNCSLYVSLEPCSHKGKTPPCASLIKELGFQKVYIGILDSNEVAAGGAEELKKAGINVEISKEQDSFESLIEPFLKWKKNPPFVFFKLAMSANDVITGGTISSKDSRTHMHRLRDKVDLLVIGGNTVRQDRPTLDARLCGGRAPNVLIYSKTKDFDKTTPLFHVAGRKVFISDSLEILSNYSFVMVEGGQGMLDACAPFIDWYLVYQTSEDKEGRVLQWPIKKEPLFSKKIHSDTLTWYKKSE